MKIKTAFILSMVVIMVSCGPTPMETVPEVDLDKFMGTWYEIASLPTTYNKGCTCSKTDMELAPDNEYVRMINSCMKKNKQGAVLAKAFIIKNSGNAKMRVQMFWPFRSDYYIIEIAPDYSFAMVGNPDKSFLQILSRTKTLDEKSYDELLFKATNLGFEISSLKKTDQTCQ